MFSLAALASGVDGVAFGNYGESSSYIPFMSTHYNFNYILQLINYGIHFLGLSAWISPQTVMLLASNPLVLDSLKLLMLGSFIETGRRVFTWLLSLFTFRYSVSGEFRSGDQTYEWLVSYLVSTIKSLLFRYTLVLIKIPWETDKSGCVAHAL